MAYRHEGREKAAGAGFGRQSATQIIGSYRPGSEGKIPPNVNRLLPVRFPRDDNVIGC